MRGTIGREELPGMLLSDSLEPDLSHTSTSTADIIDI